MARHFYVARTKATAGGMVIKPVSPSFKSMNAAREYLNGAVVTDTM